MAVFCSEMIAYLPRVINVELCLSNFISAMRRRQFDFPFSQKPMHFLLKSLERLTTLRRSLLLLSWSEWEIFAWICILSGVVLGDAHFHQHQKLHHVKSWSLSFIYIWKKVKTPEHKKSENKSCHAVRRYGCRSFTPSFSTQHITTFLFLLK